MQFRRNIKQKEKEYKQAILVRTDLKMAKGKIASQVSHASVDSVLKSDRRKIDLWKKQGMKKVVLKVVGEKEIESSSFTLRSKKGDNQSFNSVKELTEFFNN